MKREWATVAAWVIGPPTVAVLVLVGDGGAIGWPPPPSRWIGWSATVGPAIAVAAIARAVVLVACGLTSLRVGVALVQALIGDPSMPSPRPMAPGPLRRALCRLARPTAVAGVGVGLASASLLPGATTAALASSVGAQPLPTSPVGQRGGDGPEGASPRTPPAASYAEMRRVDIVLGSITEVPTARDEVDVWVVERGDHLWAIAHETLTEHLGREPSDRRVARYWRRLIEANLDRLVIPGDPDVILPGQRLALPRAAPGRDQRSGT